MKDDRITPRPPILEQLHPAGESEGRWPTPLRVLLRVLIRLPPKSQWCWGRGGLLLLLLLFGPLTAHAQPRAEAPNGPPIGSPALAFVLPDTQGRPVHLEDYKGQTVVLNFWAFWCDTWKAEMPSLTDLAGRQDEMHFRLVAVSVDGTRLSEFARRTGGSVPFPVLLDGGGRVSTQYRVRHVPTVVIIGPDGVVRFTAYGYPGNQVVLRELRKIGAGK